MKRFVSAILLFSFLASTTELHEIFKFPHLVSHFVEHYSEASGTSLGDFLHDHYTHHHDDTDHQDEHHDTGCLPFQGNHHAPLNIFGGLYFEQSTGIDFALHAPSCQKFTNLSETFESQHYASIWQPPKIG